MKAARILSASPSCAAPSPTAPYFSSSNGLSLARSSSPTPSFTYYVIREEFQNVVEDDFDGRKVRFIGDCIHALLAEGNNTQTDEKKSVAEGFSCAGGLQSSFGVCRQELRGIGALGLAIGIELGPTPISRIGIRGERSVRLASSVATTFSERMQKDCGGGEVKLGPGALRILPTALFDLVDHNGMVAGLTYDDVSTCLSVDSSTTAAPTYARAHTPSMQDVPRAHATTK